MDNFTSRNKIFQALDKDVWEVLVSRFHLRVQTNRKCHFIITGNSDEFVHITSTDVTSQYLMHLGLNLLKTTLPEANEHRKTP
jgi:hypothetical protein